MSGCCDSGSTPVLAERDPVCGRAVNRVTAWRHEHEYRDYFFCGERCQQRFIANPVVVHSTPSQDSVKSLVAKAWARFATAVRKGRTT